MAEERLMDDDKDKKYRFRKNENGEEELIIEGGDEAEEPAEEMSFEVPDGVDDDEEAAVMTPEQLAAKVKQKNEEQERLNKKINWLLDTAEEDFKANKYATALEALAAAEELDDENGRLYALKLKVFTCGFTDYTHLEEAADAAESVAKYSDSNDKAEMLAKAEVSLKANISKSKKLVDQLDRENEEKKAERAVKFKADRNKSLIIFSVAAVPFIVILALAIYFATMIFAARDGHYMMLTIVFGIIAFVLFIVTAFCARGLNIACRRVRLNKKNTMTKLGRQLIEEEDKLNYFNTIYSELKD
jgi:uncharacterized membrane protein